MEAQSYLQQPKSRAAEWRKRLRLTRQEKAAFLFILPLMIPMIIYWIIPSLESLYFSLTNYSVVMPTKWVGLQNFLHMVDDRMFWKALWNSAYFTIGNIPLVIVGGLTLALLVNAKIHGGGR